MASTFSCLSWSSVLPFLIPASTAAEVSFKHGNEFSQIVFGSERAVSGNDFHVVRDFGQNFFVAGDHALHAAAAIDVDKRKHAAVEKIIAHVDHVGLLEEDHAVAIGVAVGKMDGVNIFAIQMD